MRRPNIFIILIDTLRRDRLGAYGYARDTSPNIDQFASEAVVFENAYTAAPWTLPSHTSLFTGLACELHGVNSDLCTLDNATPTLAERLSAAGYRCFGYSGNPFVGTIYGLARGFDRFANAHELRTEFSAPADWDDAMPVEHDKGAADIVRRFNEQLRAVATEDRPLFAFFNLTEPHHPFYPPTPFRLRYWREIGEVDAVTRDAALAVSESNFNVMTGRVALDNRGYQLLNAWYDGGVRYADHRAGEIIAAIRSSKRGEDAMIVVMSDHGELLGERGIVGHTWSVLDPVVRVPMIVQFAGERAPSTCPAIVQTQDVFATVLAAAGAGLPPEYTRDLAAVVGTGVGRSFAIVDRARIDNDGLTFKLLQNKYTEECADRYNPIHMLIHPTASLRSVVDADRKVIVRTAPTYQQIEFERGVWNDKGVDKVLRWIHDSYQAHCGVDVNLGSVPCRETPAFDFMEELRNAQVSDRLRDLGYIE